MPDLSALHTLFFDLDGVIFDSRGPITRCMNRALCDVGLAPEPPEVLARSIGRSLRTAFEAVLRGRGLAPGLADACVHGYREHYRSVCLETEAFEGIPEVLDHLGGAYRLAVATSKPEAFARPILEARGLDRYFEHLAAPPLEKTHLEDKTATLGRGLAALGVSGSEGAPAPAVMIGDRASDIAAGRHHALVTVGAVWGLGGEDELREAGADLLAPAPVSLRDLLAPAPASPRDGLGPRA